MSIATLDIIPITAASNTLRNMDALVKLRSPMKSESIFYGALSLSQQPIILVIICMSQILRKVTAILPTRMNVFAILIVNLN